MVAEIAAHDLSPEQFFINKQKEEIQELKRNLANKAQKNLI